MRKHDQWHMRGGWSMAARDIAWELSIWLQAVGRLVWTLLTLPVAAARFFVAAGRWMLRAIVTLLFGLIGMVVLGNLLFGLGYVLFYPWLR